ncbi:MAG: SOS response-associated peptidase [Thermoleophilia bacterium]|jgi:putative SOS response-associated peptidase YedK
MCGSFTQPGDIEIVKRFSVQYGLQVQAQPNSNPAQMMPPHETVVTHPYRDVWTIYADKEGNHKLTGMYWELIHHWNREFKSPYTNFNTRAESLDKPNNARLLENRRCVFPALSFFETRKTADGKTVKPREAYEFSLKDHGLIALGGVYTVWHNPADENDRRLSCSIITMEPNEVVGEVHPRMPFILAAEAVPAWLDPSVTDTDLLKGLIRPFDSERILRSREEVSANAPGGPDSSPPLF